MMMEIRSNGMGRLGDQSLTDIITTAAQANGVPVNLALAQAQRESGMNPNATHLEPNGCMSYGLFQLEDCYFASQGNLSDPVTNANLAMAYLAQLYAKYGDWADALDAYNEGPTAFDQGNRAGAGYANTILASAGVSPTTSSPALAVSSAPSPAPVLASSDMATVGLIAVGGILALNLLS